MENRIKVFIDTNILLDYFQQGREGHAIATELFNLVYHGLVEAAISTQCILDAAYVCRKHSSYIASLFRESVHYMLTRTNAGYLDPFDVKTALEDPDPDIEDSAQISFAYSQSCDVFVTSDKKLLSRELPSPMKAMTPEDFVNACRA
ncbi:MAG: PIN domain-containing protein [Bacteroidales bacterium]|nr:PIN domain-containing protein [Bacteroidales bacterium]